VAAVIAFVSPEFPFLFMMLLLPYLSGTPYSTEILVSLSLISLLSFSRKVFLGKRVYAFGASDILILIFVLAIVAAGVIGGGKDSTAGALSLVAIAFVYIPAANIIVNRRLADCAVNSVVFSAAPVAIYAIVDYVITWVGGERQPTSSLMSTPEVLAAMLTATFLLALVSMRGMRHSVQKGIYVVFLVICAFALFATHCVPVLIVFAVSLIAYAIIANVSLPKELLIFPFCAPLLIFLLPPSLLATVSEGLGMSMTFGEMRGQMLSALELFRENLVLGIGANGFDVGEGYPYFNSPLGIACRFGAVAVGALAVLLLIRLRQASVYSLCLKNSSVRRTSNMTLLSLFALMTLGWFYDVFSDLSVYTLFLAVFGMSTAALRISRSEYDTRHELYDDQRNLSFSALDVSVSGRR